MPYQQEQHSIFRSDLKAFKNDKIMQKVIINCMQLIKENPTIGIALSGAWLGFQKHKFRVSGVQYRIVFSYYECCFNNNDGTDNTTANTDNTSRVCTYTDEIDVQNCSGFIDFCAVRSRGEMTKLYAQNKKYTDGFRR